MRVIVVDTKKLEVYEDDTHGEDFLKYAYRTIGCHTVELVRLGDEVDVWCDEEGTFTEGGKPKRWVYFERTQRFPPGLQLVGTLIITGGGDKDGNTLPAVIALEELKKRLVFVVKPS